MNRQEFDTHLSVLKQNFEKRSNELTSQQEDIWFDKTRKWSSQKWRKTVDQLIEKCERYPVLAQILNVGSNIAEELNFYTSVGCKRCDSKGFVIAKDIYSECMFRCPECKISEEKVSIEVPEFNVVAIRAGFVERIQEKEIVEKQLSKDHFSLYEEEKEEYESI